MSYENLGTPTGNNLYITIPQRGTKNWDENIKDGCFQKISDHDHTPGKGAAIQEAALDSALQTKISAIATNTSNISTNTSNISTNTAAIAGLTAGTGSHTSITNSSEANAYNPSDGDIVTITGSFASVYTISSALKNCRIFIGPGIAVTFSGSVTGCTITSQGAVAFSSGLYSSNVTCNNEVFLSLISGFQGNTIVTDTFRIVTGTSTLDLMRSFIKCNTLTYTSGGGALSIDETVSIEGINISGSYSITLGGNGSYTVPSLSNVAWSINNGIFKADLISRAVLSSDEAVSHLVGETIPFDTLSINSGSKFTVSGSNTINLPCKGRYRFELYVNVQSSSYNVATTVLLGLITPNFNDFSNATFHRPALGSSYLAVGYGNLTHETVYSGSESLNAQASLTWVCSGVSGSIEADDTYLQITFLGSEGV